jgi:hypothetical protein
VGSVVVTVSVSVPLPTGIICSILRNPEAHGKSTPSVSIQPHYTHLFLMLLHADKASNSQLAQKDAAED